MSDTTDTEKRHRYTNDALAAFLVAAFTASIGLTAIGIFDLSVVPDFPLVVFTTAFGIAVAWAFGAAAVEAWRGGEGG